MRIYAFVVALFFLTGASDIPALSFDPLREQHGYRDLLRIRDRLWTRLYQSPTIRSALKNMVVKADDSFLGDFLDSFVPFDIRLVRYFNYQVREVREMDGVSRSAVGRFETLITQDPRATASYFGRVDHVTDFEVANKAYPSIRYELEKCINRDKTCTDDETMDELEALVSDTRMDRNMYDENVHFLRKREVDNAIDTAERKTFLESYREFCDDFMAYALNPRPGNQLAEAFAIPNLILNYNFVLLNYLITRFTTPEPKPVQAESPKIFHFVQCNRTPKEVYESEKAFHHLLEQNTAYLLALYFAAKGVEGREMSKFKLWGREPALFVGLMHLLLDSGFCIPLVSDQEFKFADYLTITRPSQLGPAFDAAFLLRHLTEGDNPASEFITLAEKVVVRMLQSENANALRQDFEDQSIDMQLRLMKNILIFLRSPHHNSRTLQVFIRGLRLMGNTMIYGKVERAVHKWCKVESDDTGCEAFRLFIHFASPPEISDDNSYGCVVPGLERYLREGDASYPIPEPELSLCEIVSIIKFDLSLSKQTDLWDWTVWKPEIPTTRSIFWDWLSEKYLCGREGGFFRVIQFAAEAVTSMTMSRLFYELLRTGPSCVSRSELEKLMQDITDNPDLDLRIDWSILDASKWRGTNNFICFLLMRQVGRVEIFHFTESIRMGKLMDRIQELRNCPSLSR